jgi:Leucine-rich repeat (LRR) protein
MGHLETWNVIAYISAKPEVVRNTMRVFLIISLSMIFSCTSRTKYNQTALDLGNNRLKQLPDSILKMQNLKYLNLGNAFTLYPPLSALGSDKRSTGKDDNQLTELPQEFTQLKRLSSLYIHANQLKELPIGFHRLEQLDTLDMSFNEHLELSTIMGELEKMSGLKYLNIIGISANPNLIEKLKKSLPNTKVITKLDELEFETEKVE